MRWISGLLAMALLPQALAAPAAAQMAPWASGPRVERHGGDSRFYGRDGRYLGRSESRGDVTRHYDRSGRYQGRSEEGAGGTLRHYDAQGRYQGRSERR